MKKWDLIIIVVLVVAVITGLVYYLETTKEEILSEPSVPSETAGVEPPAAEESGGEATGEATEEKMPTLEELGAGEIGEVAITDETTGEAKPLITPMMPPSIFSVTGKILNITADSLVIMGDGKNFADGASRELTCTFTDNTLVFTKNQLQYYKGREGLKALKAGMTVLVGSAENIRGRTEFSLKTVNIL